MAETKTLGTTLRKTSSPSMTIGGLTSIGAIKLENSEIEVTNLSDQVKRTIPGLLDAGDLSISGFVISENDFSNMLELLVGQSEEEWAIDYPTGYSITFKGYLKSWERSEASVDGAIGFSGTIRITSIPEIEQTLSV